MHLALKLLKKIPKGKVVSYKELNRIADTSPRAIGMIMRNNKEPEKYPCYKVIKENGEIGGYSKGIKKKIKLLKKDGIIIKKGKIDKKYFWRYCPI